MGNVRGTQHANKDKRVRRNRSHGTFRTERRLKCGSNVRQETPCWALVGTAKETNADGNRCVHHAHDTNERKRSQGRKILNEAKWQEDQASYAQKSVASRCHDANGCQQILERVGQDHGITEITGKAIQSRRRGDDPRCFGAPRLIPGVSIARSASDGANASDQHEGVGRYGANSNNEGRCRDQSRRSVAKRSDSCGQTQNSCADNRLDKVEHLIGDGRRASSLALLGTSLGGAGSRDLESCFGGSTGSCRGRRRSTGTAPRPDTGNTGRLGGWTLKVEGRCGLLLRKDACCRCHQKEARSVEAHDVIKTS
mmetsp:Transcript_2480/g.5670  ORF Transcript_2480/g.5670 Transcript_2480/m.5670 type:complete len:311 (+) Transcript_2480:659-1591(+)